MEEARETLIQRFEWMIDLPAYLGQRGFTPAVNQPGPRGLVMSDPRGPTTLVLEQAADHDAWTYAPIDRPHERGTVTTYLEQHDRLDRAACLERLIALVGSRRTKNADVLRYRAYVHHRPEVLRRAQQAYLHARRQYQQATRLLERVGIRRDAFDEWRFGNLATENDVMRVLAEPAELWTSRYCSSDNRLIFTERPIDSISLEQASRDRRTCYVAVGGHLGDGLRARVANLLDRLPTHMSVVLGFGRDQNGRRLVDDIAALAPHMHMERLSPAYGTRWNDQARLENRHAHTLSEVAQRSARYTPAARPAETTVLVSPFASP